MTHLRRGSRLREARYGGRSKVGGQADEHDPLFAPEPPEGWEMPVWALLGFAAALVALGFALGLAAG